jgi:hypothetical protein
VKTLLLSLVLAVATATASPDNPTREELHQTVLHIQRLAKEQQTELDAAHGNEQRLQSQLTIAQSALGVATSSLAIAEKKIKKLADDATAEREARIAVEKKLSWYRWHWWGSWIALGAGVLACGAFAFLKFTGRLAFTGAKIAAKVEGL